MQCTIAFPVEYVISYLFMEFYLKLVLYGCSLPEVEGMYSANNWIS